MHTNIAISKHKIIATNSTCNNQIQGHPHYTLNFNVHFVGRTFSKISFHEGDVDICKTNVKIILKPTYIHKHVGFDCGIKFQY